MTEVGVRARVAYFQVSIEGLKGCTPNFAEAIFVGFPVYSYIIGLHLRVY